MGGHSCFAASTGLFSYPVLGDGNFATASRLLARQVELGQSLV